MDHNKSSSSATDSSPSTLMIAQEYDRAFPNGDYTKAVELVEAAFTQCDDVPSRYKAVIQQCERACVLLIPNPTDPASLTLTRFKDKLQKLLGSSGRKTRRIRLREKHLVKLSSVDADQQNKEGIV